MLTAISPVRQSYNTSFKGKKNVSKMITVKAHNSIDKYYEKELKQIQKQKKEKSLIEKLDPRMVLEKIKDKILIMTGEYS